MKRDNVALNKVKISGGNSINFINNCVNCGLKLRNIDRTTSRDFTFEINDRDYKQLITLDNRGCNITIDKVGGKKRLVALHIKINLNGVKNSYIIIANKNVIHFFTPKFLFASSF